jgi:hypothetical protein
MLAKMCDWTTTGKGQLICSLVATVGGAHLVLTSPQKVLGILPAFSFSLFGKEIGAQQLVGVLLLTCGVCAFGACCLGGSKATTEEATE